LNNNKKDIKFVKDLLHLCNRAKKDNIDTFDQHADNIGRKDDKLYFFDNKLIKLLTLFKINIKKYNFYGTKRI